MAKYLLAIDQGTTGSTSLVMDESGKTVSRVNVEFPQHYPRPGWVEHDPEDIWKSVLEATSKALDEAGLSGNQIAAIGITNQRETTVLWDKQTGRPVHNAIVWQCRRTAPTCAELKDKGLEQTVRERTGLVLDPYFSGTKIGWLLEHVDGLNERARDGRIAFGTIDSFLVNRLTGGRVHVTDVTNASRTLLMNLETCRWDEQMCSMLGVPMAILPTIVGNAEKVGETRGVPGLPDGIPITGMAGDQHAALFGQQCREVGDVKCTYGTGAFVLVNTGSVPKPSKHGLLSTVAWRIGQQTTYALEGSAFIAGAAVQWLRDGLGLIRSASEIERLARQVDSAAGVVFVPALAGLGAPYWDADARGLITGITRGTTAAHLAYATLEGIAQEVTDLLEAMGDDLGSAITRLRVDGGAAANDLLMQLQADLSGVQVQRPTDLETTARGAAMFAAVGAGIVASVEQASQMYHLDRSFDSRVEPQQRNEQRGLWKRAIERTRSQA